MTAALGALAVALLAGAVGRAAAAALTGQRLIDIAKELRLLGRSRFGRSRALLLHVGRGLLFALRLRLLSGLVRRLGIVRARARTTLTSTRVCGAGQQRGASD